MSSASSVESFAPLLIVPATVLSYILGWAIGLPVLVPLLNTLAGFPFMYAALKRGDVGRAILRMLLWALVMGVCATVLSYVQPARTDALFLRGRSYRVEMFDWIRTGIGAESDPSRFIPEHAAHLFVFAWVAVATGGILALAMGAVLMNYMGHYVGALAAASARPIETMALAWHPWAVIRIASFVTIGVVLSGPVLSRVGGFRFEWRSHRRLLGYAAAGLLIDVVLKWLLAPSWHGLLFHVVGW